ncbi:methyltransferase domain-containing protein [Sodalis sp. C49]|uniref:methyltransferase domain-containing protein n=1 Tax=Sodalis sp. C49 TaxID=3228929 RepID=UPI0039659624
MTNIENYVSSLPECYQLIYGHPELEIKTSRNCNDRLVIIEGFVQKLREELGRPLRLLDLGCAQGFFSLNLAKYCSEVKGIDFLDKNIELCKALAEEFSFDNVEFHQDTVQNVIQALDFDQYDLVLGFSIFHHVCHSDGFHSAKQQINSLANKSSALLLELAVKEEGLYWADSLPEKPELILDDIAFNRILGEFGTHLTNVTRPLFMASSKFWYIENEIQPIRFWSKESHEFSYGIHQDSRRYYWSNTKFLKIYNFYGKLSDLNKNDLNVEVANLQKFSDYKLKTIKIPNIHYYGEDHGKGYLVYDLIPGERLSQLIANRQAYNALNIYKKLINQLCELESINYYHNDVRVWNILVDNEDVHLIDFSSICEVKLDVVWPYNIFLSFLIFINEVDRGKEPVSLPHRSPLFLFYWPKDMVLKVWLAKIWQTPADEWSFSKFNDYLLQAIEDVNNPGLNFVLPVLPEKNIALWLAANEALLRETAMVRDYLDDKYTHQDTLPLANLPPTPTVDAHKQELLAIIGNQEAVHDKLLTALNAESDRVTQLTEANQQLLLQNQQQAEIIARIHSSISWFITKPLRWAKKTVR